MACSLTEWEEFLLTRMEAVLPVALNVYHASCQTVSRQNEKCKISLFFYTYLYPFLSQWFCIRNTAMWLLTEKYKGSRGRSLALMKKEGTRHPLATSPHPVHFAPREAPPSPSGRIFLTFAPADNWTTSATKNVNYRRWFYVQSAFYYFILQHILLRIFLISGQVRVGDVRGLIHTQPVYCSWPFYDVRWALWVSGHTGEAVALLQTAGCERSQWEVRESRPSSSQMCTLGQDIWHFCRKQWRLVYFSISSQVSSRPGA